jgi:hypothetical protein
MGGWPRRALRWSIWTLGSALVLVTLLPLVRSNEWWIRIWDFPRFQIAGLAACVLTAALLALDRKRRAVLALASALVGVLGWQADLRAAEEVVREGREEVGK